jgi:hypothetical protein
VGSQRVLVGSLSPSFSRWRDAAAEPEKSERRYPMQQKRFGVEQAATLAELPGRLPLTGRDCHELRGCSP